ncbi:hypothetical protein PSTT_10735 [Puccinia striiformis]|uniref:Uncharacterized protein n=1 Tax=Puccinia striiformis TaxID=27350 RepID=A0A2S4V367_9BASI|nr:hypothetical protein PSTT_10735 [Puccinia striiformis]
MTTIYRLEVCHQTWKMEMHQQPFKIRTPREPTIKDLEDSPETTPQNQDKGKQPEQTGYGLHNAQDVDEDDLPTN